MNLESIRTRLTLAAVSAVTLFGAIVGLVARDWISRDLHSGLKQFAQHELHELSTAVGDARRPGDLEARRTALERLFPEDDLLALEVWTANGELAFGFPAGAAPLHGPWPEGLRSALAGGAPWVEHTPPDQAQYMRTATLYQGEGQDWVLMASVRTGRVEDSVSQFTYYYSSGLLALALLSAGGAYFLVGRALEPVLSLVHHASNLAAEGERWGRLEVPGEGSELSELVGLINELLTRADETVERLRRFTAHAGHELRTPLSRMRGEVEQALRSGNPEERLSALHGVLEEIDVQRGVLDALLQLAHSGEVLDLAHEAQVELSALVEEIGEEARLLLDEGRELRLDVQGEVVAPGQRPLLARVIWNLILNALSYSPPGSQLSVRLERVAGSVNLEVENALGPGLQPLEERLFEPFARGDRSGNSEHHGLGLALARAIARRHGGELRGSTSESGRVRVWLELPPPRA